VSTGEDLPEWALRDSNARPLAPEATVSTVGSIDILCAASVHTPRISANLIGTQHLYRGPKLLTGNTQ
jgi:hypothetical protein